MKILVFGDSIAHGVWDREGGWAQRLRRFLDEKKFPIPLFNLSITTETTEDLLKRFEFETEQRMRGDEIIIIFAIGVNDSQIFRGRELVPPERFEKNVEKLVNLAGKYTEKIVFLGLLPVDEEKTNPVAWNPDVSYRNDRIEKYNGIIKKVCEARGIPFIDLFGEWFDDYKNYLDDGLHPNSEGHKRIFETVKNFLIKNEYLEV